jgi:peptidoglycan/xylan/chitin deacetylase (PgdA/CDA1 family)
MATPLEVEAFLFDGYVFERPSILLTFDDGLIDHYLVATTYLAEQGVSAAFFISTEPLIKRSVLTVHKAQWLRANIDPELLRKTFFSLAENSIPDNKFTNYRNEADAHYRFDNSEDAYMKYLINFILPSDVVDNILTKILLGTGITEGELNRELYMHEEQILDLHKQGHLIGAHSHRHIPLHRIEDDFVSDIGTNIDVISRAIGTKPRWIAYPHGTTETIPKAPRTFCQKYGFAIGLTMEPGWNSSDSPPYRMLRIEQNDINSFVDQQFTT